MKKHSQISDGELAIMRLLWSDGQLSSRQIMEQLYPDCSASDHATIHSMLKRLEAKSLVTRNRDTHPHIFVATVTQAKFAGQQFAVMVNKVSGGSLAPFLSHLIQSDSLTKAQLDELRSMLDKPEKNKTGGQKSATRSSKKPRKRNQ